MAEKKQSRWEWIERAAVLTGMVLGIIAFIWQLQERIVSSREQLLVLPPRLERISDTLFYVELDVLNAGKKAVHIRKIELVPHSPLERITRRERMIGLWRELTLYSDSASILQIDADRTWRFKSNPISPTRLCSIRDLDNLEVRTIRGEHSLPLDNSNLAFEAGIFINDFARCRTQP
jgi:hypothetical protein